jgi:hypothetical protein
VLDCEGILDKDRFWREQLLEVNKKYLFGGGSTPTGSKGFVGGHAYAVLEAWEEGDLRLLKLRNPWGEVHTRPHSRPCIDDTLTTPGRMGRRLVRRLETLDRRDDDQTEAHLRRRWSLLDLVL